MTARALLTPLACLLALAAPAAAATKTTPHLSYAAAKRAAQAKADSFAGTRTRITAMYKLGDTRYSARAEWNRENPTGCAGCGYDPVTGNFYDTPTVESCSVGLAVTLKQPHRVVARTEDFACY